MTPGVGRSPAASSVAVKIPRLRLELQPSATLGKGFDRPVVIVLERGVLPKNRTDMGELRLGDHQQLTAWWTGFRFEL